MNRVHDIINNFFKNKKIVYIFIAILILFLFFLLFYNGDKKSESSDSVIQYKNEMEEQLENILSSIKGAGKVKVAINITSGTETVLAMKTVTSEANGVIETTETPILVNGKTVVVKELYPKISGVLIVAEGAGNLSVYKKIQQATISLLGTNVNNIEIMTMG